VCNRCEIIKRARIEEERKQRIEVERQEKEQAELDRQIAEAQAKLDEAKRAHAAELDKMRKEAEIRKLEIERARQVEENELLKQAAANANAAALDEMRAESRRRVAEVEFREKDLQERQQRQEEAMEQDVNIVASIVALADAANQRDVALFLQLLGSIDGALQVVVAQRLTPFVGGTASDWFSAQRLYAGKVHSHKFAHAIAQMTKSDYINANGVFKPVVSGKDMKSNKGANKSQLFEEQFAKMGLNLCDIKISSPSTKTLRLFEQKMNKPPPLTISHDGGRLFFFFFGLASCS
jgi:hypothetical protein